jgi:hypothetical protein
MHWCSEYVIPKEQKKDRGLPGMKEGPLVQMLDRQRVQQAAADEAKKLVDAAALADERLQRKLRKQRQRPRRQLHCHRPKKRPWPSFPPRIASIPGRIRGVLSPPRCLLL